MVTSLSSLYEQRSNQMEARRFQNAWGDRYQPPARFTHGEMMQIAYLPAETEGGADVTVFEARWPARFYIAHINGIEIATGSGEDAFLVQLVERLRNGMLTVQKV